MILVAVLFVTTLVSGFAFNRVFDLNFVQSIAAPLLLAGVPVMLMDRLTPSPQWKPEDLISGWLGLSTVFALVVGVFFPDILAAAWTDGAGRPVLGLLAKNEDVGLMRHMVHAWYSSVTDLLQAVEARAAK